MTYFDAELSRFELFPCIHLSRPFIRKRDGISIPGPIVVDLD